jgi:ElaB/YqjD/DUF883 family membrane-anchored ribosome-binding protein
LPEPPVERSLTVNQCRKDTRLKQEESIMGTLDRTSEYARDVAEYAHEASDKIAGAASQAAEVLSEQGERLLSAEQKLVKSCGKYVRANPVTSVGIMIAVGFVLAGLLSRRD